MRTAYSNRTPSGKNRAGRKTKAPHRSIKAFRRRPRQPAGTCPTRSHPRHVAEGHQRRPLRARPHQAVPHRPHRRAAAVAAGGAQRQRGHGRRGRLLMALLLLQVVVVLVVMNGMCVRMRWDLCVQLRRHARRGREQASHVEVAAAVGAGTTAAAIAVAATAATAVAAAAAAAAAALCILVSRACGGRDGRSRQPAATVRAAARSAQRLKRRGRYPPSPAMRGLQLQYG